MSAHAECDGGPRKRTTTHDDAVGAQGTSGFQATNRPVQTGGKTRGQDAPAGALSEWQITQESGHSPWLRCPFP
ncbi:hypothetical protein RISK_001927 [Rhodopirellula islandica]|uniref:Uncharacterized protein n=1 Tax=Rhodopirellula islandica TaxID=595434 RepID=A0A0J1BHQ8_RHOIS|nr:hypothetical protein [Rhodopirellula islandica]KLU06076.1 hypothetical protein RISK_001927 [Rhodopirellula islandica]